MFWHKLVHDEPKHRRYVSFEMSLAEIGCSFLLLWICAVFDVEKIRCPLAIPKNRVLRVRPGRSYMPYLVYYLNQWDRNFFDDRTPNRMYRPTPPLVEQFNHINSAKSSKEISIRKSQKIINFQEGNRPRGERKCTNTDNKLEWEVKWGEGKGSM